LKGAKLSGIHNKITTFPVAISSSFGSVMMQRHFSHSGGNQIKGLKNLEYHFFCHTFFKE